VLQRLKEERNIHQTKEEGRLTGLVTSSYELPSKTRYWMKDRGKDRSWLEGEEEDVSSYLILMKRGVLDIERESNRSHYVENSIWKNLWWTCSKTNHWNLLMELNIILSKTCYTFCACLLLFFVCVWWWLNEKNWNM